MTPIELTNALLQVWGFRSEHVERFIQPPGKQPFRKDFGGFADKIAWPKCDVDRFYPNTLRFPVAIQVCARERLQDHIRKLCDMTPPTRGEAVGVKALDWWLCGAALQVWAWKNRTQKTAEVKIVHLVGSSANALVTGETEFHGLQGAIDERKDDEVCV